MMWVSGVKNKEERKEFIYLRPVIFFLLAVTFCPVRIIRLGQLATETNCFGDLVWWMAK